jgi:hypothetical protein
MVTLGKRPRYLLDWVAGILSGHHARRALSMALLLAGVVVQILLLLTAAYLCDLALSLMELWADLARKHLELTM